MQNIFKIVWNFTFFYKIEGKIGLKNKCAR